LKFGSEYQRNGRNYFNPFLRFSLDRLTWAMSHHYQFNWVCEAHLEYKVLDIEVCENYWRLRA